MARSGWLKYWPVFCLIPYLGWWLIGLTDLDEGFYGAVAADMIRRGDWITPSISGKPWFEKPILIYWLAIPSIQVFGETIGPKLPSVLASLACAWLVFWFVKRRVSDHAAPLASLAVSGSFLLVAVGRMMLTDALLTASLCGCLFLYWESLVEDPRMRMGSAACLGLAVLAKGPVSGIFFLVIAALTYLLVPDTRKGARGWWLPSIGIVIAVIAAWYLPCWLINRQEFVQKFLIEQNLGRFAGGDKAHGLPHWSLHLIYYPVVLAVGLLPWLPGALARLKKPWTGHEGVNRYLLIWGLVILFFFSISGSKLPHYIVPAMPPLMILAACSLGLADEDRRARLMAGAAAWAVFGFIASTAIFGYEYSRQKGPDLHQLVRDVRTEEGSFVLWRFGRSTSDTSFKLQINETSRPSIHFYLRKPAVEATSVEDLEGIGGSMVLLSPKGRMEVQDRKEAQRRGILIDELPFSQRGDFQAFRATTQK